MLGHVSNGEALPCRLAAYRESRCAVQLVAAALVNVGWHAEGRPHVWAHHRDAWGRARSGCRAPCSTCAATSTAAATCRRGWTAPPRRRCAPVGRCRQHREPLRALLSALEACPAPEARQGGLAACAVRRARTASASARLLSAACALSRLCSSVACRCETL